ncbi:MAG TPA: TadE/TadG family type IV pilus assembly protein [bacterium]|jgi:Flp pilus assembly protein TadG|nr:TadE/TadG family type IV pilus assembly protein [bacterium]
MRKSKGQSAVEFVLIAPVLFILFFGIIQLFYIAYVLLAVQRATHAIAQQAAASDNPDSFLPQFQIIEALLPLEQLSSATLSCALSSKCDIHSDGTTVFVTVSYPMPLWVPIIKNLMGQNLDTSSALGLVPPTLTSVLQAVGLGISTPNTLAPTKVIWVNFEAKALDENSIGAET